MLKSLNISNLAVVSKVQVEFGEGLNLLTGETGSGKSIIVDALAILLGGRASQEVIRSGETKAFVEGYFRIKGHTALFEKIEEAGIETDRSELAVRREISATGRSRAFINDELTSVSFLRDLRPFLVDIHGQHDQQTLFYPDAHLDLLDLFAGHERERAELKVLYTKWRELERELKQLRRDEAERLRSLDILDFQVREIEQARLEVGEDYALEQERKVLANAEKVSALASQCYSLLYESEAAALTQLGLVSKKIEELASLDQRFAPYVEALRTARYSIEDAAYFLRDCSENLDFSAERLQQVEDRLVDIERLKRKYGGSVELILKSAADMRERLVQLQNFEAHEQELSKRFTEAEEGFMELAKVLSQKRREAARALEMAVMGELKHLAMERTQFVINFMDKNRSEGFDYASPVFAEERGIDTVEFYVSPNPGEEMKPLAKIASGGEISRLCLALKTITAPTEYPRTLVFDEVDVGIGGRVAESVGQRLKRLASSNQVLCVTHQAQIARFADVHHSVGKRIIDDRTEVFVARLDQTGRIEELARMIGGSQITDLTRQHAHELLFNM